MCGIAAVTGPDSHAEVIALVRAMRHRGPDSHGVVSYPFAAMGMSRLKVMDPRALADQPMTRGTNTLVYNGELYNFKELRAELADCGVAFETDGDTEVVLEALRTWGAEQACKRFEGMFAFVYADTVSGAIWFARDRFGIKPLYWRARGGGGIAICSEAKYLASGGEYEPSALAEYFEFGSPISKCVFDNVLELQPGTLMTLRAGSIDQVRFSPEIDFGNQTNLTPADALHKSLEQHLRADRRIALWLSGGFDSAILLATARDIGVETLALTLATGCNDDEVRRARRTADHYGVAHEIVTVDPGHVAAHMAAFTTAMDQPTIDGFNTYLMSRATQLADCAVAISGLGGDEVMGGYGYYRTRPMMNAAASVLRRLPTSVRMPVVRVAAKRMQQSPARFLAMVQAHDVASAHAGARTVFHSAEVQQLIGRDSIAVESTPGLSTRQEFARLDFDRYLRPTLLRDSDVFSMACGVELRVPLLDADFVGSVLQSAEPPTKSVLAQYWNDPYLVDLANAPKLTFSMPWRSWMTAVLEHDKPLLHSDAPWGEHVDADVARQMMSVAVATPHDSPLRLWSFAVLANWIASRERADTSGATGAATCQVAA